MNQQHVDDLIDAYVLGALEPDEVASVEAHLVTCARCQQLVATARATSAHLLLGVPLVAPPPALKARIMARIHAEATGEQVDHLPDVATAAEPVRAALPRKNALRRLVDSILGLEPLTGDAQAHTLLLRLLADPASKMWEIGGTDAAPAANARFLGDPNGRDGILVTAGLKELDPDQAYQIWLLRDGKPQPYSLFRVARGKGYQTLRASARLSDFDVVAVTPEPSTGSESPTGPIVLMGQLAA